MTGSSGIAFGLLLSLALVLLTGTLAIAQTEGGVFLPRVSDSIPSASSRTAHPSAHAQASDRLEGEAISNTVYYVKHDAAGANDGTSWTDAYTDLQRALAVAVHGDEIWVARGVYVPGKNIHRTFTLTQGVAIYGGFAGEPGSEEDWATRDYETYVTVLSGDVDRDDVTDANGVVTDTTYIRSDNSIRVVTSMDVTATATLDGLTITAGTSHRYFFGGGMENINGSPTLANLSFVGNRGEALLNEEGSPAITSVAFIGNSSPGRGAFANSGGDPTLNQVTFDHNIGGAMVNKQGNPTLNTVAFIGNGASVGGGLLNVDGSPTLVNVIFSENRADDGGGGGGGGMLSHGGNPVLRNVEFSGNHAWTGGGMEILAGNPILIDVRFTDNHSSSSGGGLWVYDGNPIILDSVFSDNWAGDGGGMGVVRGNVTVKRTQFLTNTAHGTGGGMYSQNNVQLFDVIFADNAALRGGAIHVTAGRARLANVLFVGNTAGETGGAAHIGDFMAEWATGISDLTNVVMYGNTAGEEGGGVFSDRGFAQIENSIVWNNSPMGLSGDVRVSHSNIQGGRSGVGNLDVDPLFVDAGNRDFHLQAASPLIDTGNNSLVPASVTLDLDGNPRIMGGDVDLGPFEFLNRETHSLLPAAVHGSR